MEQYHELAQRTSAPTTPEMVARMREPAVLADLAYILARISDLGHMIDTLKKHVFYGKPYSGERPETKVTDAAKHQIRYDWEVKFLHGTIGIIGEAGEMASALFRWLYQEGAILDIPNIIEELGDNAWFCEETVEAIKQSGLPDITMNVVRSANIAKLVQRFPDKFSKSNAVIRDLDRERFAVEGAFTAKSMAALPGQITKDEAKAAAKDIVDDNRIAGCGGSDPLDPA